jgi:hypothetical protein
MESLRRPHIGAASAGVLASSGILLAAALMTCSGPTGTDRIETPIRDTTPPLIRGDVFSFDDSITSALGAHIFLPADTMTFDVVARDSVLLAWIGFRFGGAANVSDSVQVPDSLGQEVVGLRVTITPPPGFAGLVTVRGFARDSAGNVTETVLNGSPASFVQPVTTYIPQVGFDVDGRGWVMDGPDGSRRLYWVTASRSVGVWEDNARSTYLSLPGQGHDIDFTLNKDSLLVTIPDSSQYAIIDLRASYPTVALVRDTVTATQGQPWLLRIAANNHAIVYRRNASDTASGSYVDWDLSSGQQRLLSGPVVHGGMERTADRSHVIIWDITACCTGRGQVYTSPAGSFAAPVTMGASPSAGVTLNAAGTRLLVGTSLHALPFLDRVAQFHLPSVLGPVALSQDGSTLFAATPQGILRVRVSDGIGYDLVSVGDPPPRLFATPDGGQLFMPFESFIRYANLPALPPRGASATAAAANKPYFEARWFFAHTLRREALPYSIVRPNRDRHTP